jgi:hypothetical protein
MTRAARPHTLRRLIGLAAVAAVLLVLAAHHGTDPAAPAKPAPAGTAAALRQLNALHVIPARSHRPGYHRGCAAGQACTFGPAWTDDTSAPGGHNGCDTRNDILRTQLTDMTYRPGSRCVVIAGVLHDPYTGHTIHFAKAHASLVQIDHLVPSPSPGISAPTPGRQRSGPPSRTTSTSCCSPCPARRTTPKATPARPRGCHPTGPTAPPTPNGSSPCSPTTASP